MAIRKMRLRNFKCFADSGDVPLAPLTVIFGRNNSGKSSILQSLLILRQTLDSPEYGPRLDLRGPQYPAGSYRDIVHQHRAKEHILMSFEVDVRALKDPAAIELEFTSDEPQPARLARLTVEHPSIDKLEIYRGRGRGGPYELSIGGKPQGGEKKAVFRFPLERFLPLIGEEPRRRGRPSKRHEATRSLARRALEGFEATLRSMRVVGAFRRQPERRYEYQGRVSEQVDSMGRNIVFALIEDATRRGKKRGELLRSVNRWLETVGRIRISSLKPISREARIFEMRLKDIDTGRWANFADVGFGIGQALPVLVEGLRTDEGDTFVVQEPEIHLHPDAQLGMADFLVSLARNGRHVIAETHSEHLLLRIRRSMLSTDSSKPLLSPADVSIVYVHGRDDGSSCVTRLDIDDMAQVTNWPAGFMEEATEERLAIMKGMAKNS
jgi:predicted ATPase